MNSLSPSDISRNPEPNEVPPRTRNTPGHGLAKLTKRTDSAEDLSPVKETIHHGMVILVMGGLNGS
jgi:hypothetical protein